MPIVLNRFGGLAPRLSPELLPEDGAQTASNVTLAGGCLAPLSVAGPLTAMHTAGALPGEIPAGELADIAKPVAPEAGTPTKLCRPLSQWLTIKAYGWSTSIESDVLVENPLFGTTENPGVTLAISKIEYTPSGLTVQATLPDSTFAVNLDAVYNVYGPIFKFELDADTGGTYGGPKVAADLPASVGREDANIPSGLVPLYAASGLCYGYFAVTDYDGPVWEQTLTAGHTGNFPLKGGSITFTIDLNYVEARQRFYRYAVAYVDADDREGPPSEKSDLVIVQPGETIPLTLPVSAGLKRRVYRNAQGGDKFYLMHEMEDAGASWTDDGTAAPGEELPPFGSFTESGVTVANDFRAGSVIHPAQFGAAFVNQTEGDETHGELWLSDVYRLHAWPKENVVAFPEGERIVALAATGGQVLVFTRDYSGTTVSSPVTGKVYAVSGGNPEAMQKYLLSDSAPLLSPASLVRRGQTVYWATHDGLAASTGGDVQIVTAGLFTRANWSAYSPATMTAYAADGCLLLKPATGDGLRIDLAGEGAAVSTYSATLPGTASSFTWKSRRFVLGSPAVLARGRVKAEGSVNVTFIRDGVADASPTSVTTDALFAIGGAAARTWEFTIESAHKVHSVEFYERQPVAAAAPVRETNPRGSLAPWLTRQYDFGERRWVRSVYVLHDGADVRLRLTHDGGTLTTDALASGRATALSALAKTAALTFEFVNAGGANMDHLVREVMIHAPTPGDGSNGVYLADPPSWVGNLYQFPDCGEWACASVSSRFKDALNSDATAALTLKRLDTGDDWTQTVGDGHLFHVSRSLGAAPLWEVSLDAGELPVFSLTLLPRRAVPAQGDLHLVSQNPALPPWAAARYVFPEPVELAGGRVLSDAAPGSTLTLRLYGDGAAAASQTVTIDSGEAFRVSSILRCTALDLKFESDAGLAQDHRVREVWLNVRRTVPVDKGGLLAAAREGEPFAWVGRVFTSPLPVAFSAVRVTAATYPVTIKLYRDGLAAALVEVPDGKARRLPRLAPARRWEVEMPDAAANQVVSAMLATSMERLGA
jgi:hypothetical protein